jgi:uncharacterized membrane protein
MHNTSRLRGFTVVLGGYAAGAAWFWHALGESPVAAATELPGRAFNALLLPTAAAVLLWSFHVIELRRAVGEREPGDCAATERILFRFIVFICGLHGLIMLQLTDAPWIQAWAPQLALVLVGALLVSVGNLLPTTRPNVLVGIRTSRSLRSRHFWMEINRVGGYVTVALGLVMIAGAVVLRYPLVGQVTGVAVLAAVGILLARYRTLVRSSERA